MKTNPILVSAAALTLLAACCPDDLAMESMDAPVPVRLAYTTVSATETRAAQDLNKDKLSGGEVVHVRIGPAYAALSSIWTDYSFTAGENGTLTTASTPPYYPAGSQNIHIVAFCPDLNTLLSFGTNFFVPNDQTSDASYKAADLMYASIPNQGKQAAPVTLHFSHKTAKLCVNVSAGEGVASILGVRINQVKTAASFDVLAGRMGNAVGTPTYITMSNYGAACFPPQTITGKILSVITDQGVATYSVPEGKTFEAGKEYTMNITVNRRAVDASNVITGWTDEGTVTIVPEAAGLEAVDLGLYEGGASSGKKLLWANMNVGATSVTDYGYYFAWGDVSGHSGEEGYNFGLVNYPYYIHIDVPFAMYNTEDALTMLKPAHDAASVYWGDGWRMPTKEEFDALLTLTKDWTTQDEVNGCKFTGSNGNSIFLPAAGFCDNSGDLTGIGTAGHYWSSTRILSTAGLGILHAQTLTFNADDAYSSERMRFYGLPVRPVRTN